MLNKLAERHTIPYVLLDDDLHCALEKITRPF